MDRVICFDNENGKEGDTSDDMIKEYLKAIETFEDIIKDKIKEIEYEEKTEE